MRAHRSPRATLEVLVVRSHNNRSNQAATLFVYCDSVSLRLDVSRYVERVRQSTMGESEGEREREGPQICFAYPFATATRVGQID